VASVAHLTRTTTRFPLSHGTLEGPYGIQTPLQIRTFSALGEHRGVHASRSGDANEQGEAGD
jgi:hypothetical protein